SCPSTDFAPIETRPSCTRIFVPCPTQLHRPSARVALRPISSFTPRPTKHSPSVLRRPRQRAFNHSQRRTSGAYEGRNMSCSRAKRKKVSRLPRNGVGGRRGAGSVAALGSSVEGRTGVIVILGGWHDCSRHGRSERLAGAAPPRR